jgi:hypothetical protein
MSATWPDKRFSIQSVDLLTSYGQSNKLRGNGTCRIVTHENISLLPSQASAKASIIRGHRVDVNIQESLISFIARSCYTS